MNVTENKKLLKTKSLKLNILKDAIPTNLLSGVLMGLVAVFGFFIFKSFFVHSKQNFYSEEKNNLLAKYSELNEKLNEMTLALELLKQRDDNLYREVLNTEKISDNIRNSGIGGTDKYADLQGYNSSEIVTATAVELDKIMQQLHIQSFSYDELFELAKNNSPQESFIPSLLPVPQNQYVLSSTFGYRFHPLLKVKRMHSGVDFSAAVGTEVFAAANGTVSEAEASAGFGKQITINHGNGFETVYAHLNKYIVNVGQFVKRGETIGYVGTTGLSSSPHLHYEVHVNNVTVNPEAYFFVETL